jgi:hypothetical protein
MELTEVGYCLIILLCIFIVWAVYMGKDLASPQLFFFAALGVFWFDIFLVQQTVYIYLIYVISLIVVFSSCFYNSRSGIITQQPPEERLVAHSLTPKNNGRRDLRPGILWLASLPSLVGTVYLIYLSGSLIEYVADAKYGTRNFAGLGPLKAIIATFYPISLYYFAVLINESRSRNDKILFCCHLFLLIILAGLSLSRGTLLSHFIFMGLVWLLLILVYRWV